MTDSQLSVSIGYVEAPVGWFVVYCNVCGYSTSWTMSDEVEPDELSEAVDFLGHICELPAVPALPLGDIWDYFWCYLCNYTVTFTKDDLVESSPQEWAMTKHEAFRHNCEHYHEASAMHYSR